MKPIPVGIAIIACVVVLVAVWLGASIAPPATMVRCSSSIDLTYDHSPTGALSHVFVADVRNTSARLIDRVLVYVRSRSAGRSIPNGECVRALSVPGGIEPGETRSIKFAVSVAYLKQGTLEAAVVGKMCPADMRPYLYYRDVRMVTVKN